MLIWGAASKDVLRRFKMNVGGRRFHVKFSPDESGSSVVVSQYPNGASQIWDVSVEFRTPEAIAELVRERVPLRYQEGKLVPR